MRPNRRPVFESVRPLTTDINIGKMDIALLMSVYRSAAHIDHNAVYQPVFAISRHTRMSGDPKYECLRACLNWQILVAHMLLDAKIADAAGASHEIFTECLRAAARIRIDAVAAFAIVGHIPFPASPRLCGTSLFARPTCQNQATASVHPRALYSGPAITDRERISGALSVETRELF